MFIMKDDKLINDISLILTLNEAIELRHTLEQLINADFDAIHHLHVSSSDYQTEITISILDKNSLKFYSKSIRDMVNGSRT